MPAAGKSRFLESAWVLAAALVLGAVTQQSLAQVASANEDRHVMQLLLQKLGLAPPEASFDAFLYLQAPEFQFLQWDHVLQAHEAWALPSAALAAVLIVAAWLRSKYFAEAPTSEPAWIVQVLFLIALILLCGLVSRLRVLTAPVLCLVGAQVGSPDLWSAVMGTGRLRRAVAFLLGHGLGLALIWAPLMHSFGDAGVVQRVKQVGAHTDDLDMRELVEWANETLQADSLLMADMTLAAKLRMISPNLRVGNHPQYESLTSRKRNRDYYRTFSCAPPHRVHEVLASYGVTHVVLNLNACKARMGKLDAFMEEPDQCGTNNQEQLQKKTFCWGGFLTQAPNASQGSPLFGLAFRNPVYTVLRLAPRGTVAAEQKSRSWTATSTWKAWLDGLEGTRAARGIARAAVSWPKRQGAGTKKAQEVAELQLRQAESLAPEDPIVMLSRAEFMQQSQGQGPAVYEAMSRAADLAAGTKLSSSPAKSATDPAALFRVFVAWKGAINQRGQSAAFNTLKNVAITLRPHLEALHDSFELCDMASWLKDWGEQKTSKKLWKLAKRDPFDQCVREDWLKWEGAELTERQTWRAFLRLR